MLSAITVYTDVFTYDNVRYSITYHINNLQLNTIMGPFFAEFGSMITVSSTGWRKMIMTKNIRSVCTRLFSLIRICWWNKYNYEHQWMSCCHKQDTASSLTKMTLINNLQPSKNLLPFDLKMFRQCSAVFVTLRT